MKNSHEICKIVIDTNIIFMAWYNPFGKCADILRKAKEGKIELYAPESVKKEIIRVFERRNLVQDEINDFLEDFPINFVGQEIYTKIINRTKVKHIADKPVEAVALILNCRILSADHHFKNRIDINKLLRDLE